MSKTSFFLCLAFTILYVRHAYPLWVEITDPRPEGQVYMANVTTSCERGLSLSWVKKPASDTLASRMQGEILAYLRRYPLLYQNETSVCSAEMFHTLDIYEFFYRRGNIHQVDHR